MIVKRSQFAHKPLVCSRAGHKELRVTAPTRRFDPPKVVFRAGRIQGRRVSSPLPPTLPCTLRRLCQLRPRPSGGRERPVQRGYLQRVPCEHCKPPGHTGDARHQHANHQRPGVRKQSVGCHGPNACIRAFNTYYSLPRSYRLSGARFMIDPSVRVLHHISHPDDQHSGFIVDGDRRLLCTRFPNYYKYMYYNANKVRYDELWRKREIYI